MTLGRLCINVSAKSNRAAREENQQMILAEKALIRQGPVGTNGRKATRPVRMAESRGIWKRFGDRDVVQDISFSVEAGEVLGVVGPNGAGKTTMMRMLLDIIQPDQGDVLLFGEPFDHAHRAMLGYLPEERGLYRDLRVRETLEHAFIIAHPA